MYWSTRLGTWLDSVMWGIPLLCYDDARGRRSLGVSSCSPGCVIHYHQHKDCRSAQENLQLAPVDGSMQRNKTFLSDTGIDLWPLSEFLCIPARLTDPHFTASWGRQDKTRGSSFSTPQESRTLHQHSAHYRRLLPPPSPPPSHCPAPPDSPELSLPVVELSPVMTLPLFPCGYRLL